MTARISRSILIVFVVVLAGCGGVYGGGGETPSPTTRTPTPASTAQETSVSTTQETSSSTTTPTTVLTPTASRFPPGTSERGIENETALLSAHVRSLVPTGFIAVGRGNGTVYRNGFLVEVRSVQRNRVAADASSYVVSRTVVAGPLETGWSAWSDGATEYRRSGNGKEPASQEPMPERQLAGYGLLLPYVRGGSYTTIAVNETGGETAAVTLEATGYDNATALKKALPKRAENVTSFAATVAVEPNGRIRSLEATIWYVIRGQNATQVLHYSVERVGNVTVTRPEWLANTTATGSDR